VSGPYGPYPAKVLDWHDGDTARIDVDLGFAQRACAYSLWGAPQLACRVRGINTPELDTAEGKAALEYARQVCPPGSLVTVVSHDWDKYGGRWLGSIMLPDGRDYAQVMLEAGHAAPYSGHGPKPTPSPGGG
jgi:endonuclease YncB( thermonuclease family)